MDCLTYPVSYERTGFFIADQEVTEDLKPIHIRRRDKNNIPA
jgi:hypothetical protein